GRPGNRLLRPIPPVLRPGARRVPAPPRAPALPGRRRRARVRDARVDRGVLRTGALRRPARDLRPPAPDRPDERHLRVRGAQRGRSAYGDRASDARAGRSRRAARGSDSRRLSRASPGVRGRGPRAGRRDVTEAGALDAVDRILNRGGDADEVLRNVVRLLPEQVPGLAWAGLFFNEQGRLVPGPASGEP